VTARRGQRGWVLPDDGVIDDLAVEIAASGARPVALTRAERQRAAALILARGGTPYVISERLRVSGSTALALAAQCRALSPEDTPGGCPSHGRKAAEAVNA
jgi:hypothetical protein